MWEVAQCYKRCMMMRRAKEEVTGWEMSEPPLVDLAWTSEGQLYAVDRDANLYAVPIFYKINVLSIDFIIGSHLF